ncbi:MAG: hypothetical protein OEZ68_05505 [Gammaproteobacteria bacterium]|nr:hypothetical protein [Gammaproteobacteria bacterium]MDH5800245.1 hypothetical protein [Gammaproteobacteria bacterium]
MSPEAATTTPDSEEQDRAWVCVELPISEAELFEFCQDIERLFRINPHLVFNEWSVLGKNEYRFTGVNSSQEQPFEFDVTMRVEPQDDGLLILYSDGLKKSTRLKVEPHSTGSKLTITDEYTELGAEEKQERLHEVDRSLVIWATDIRSYLQQWKRWGKLGFYRWYMRRIWQPLKPMGRRITYMLIWISIFEVALIALGFAIYWAENS